MGSKVLEFKGKVVREVYKSENFKIYAVDIDDKYVDDLNLKMNKYNNYSIVGDMHDLAVGIEYNITAIEQLNKKNGYNYKVKNIRRDKPTSTENTVMFLRELLTNRQTENLLKAYPNIIDMVMKNEPVDLDKVYGIGEVTFKKIKRKIIDNFCLIDLVDEYKGLLDLSMLKKLYDNYTSINKIREEMNKNPYKCMCSLARVGFKTADALLLDIDRKSKKNIKNGEKPIIDFKGGLETSLDRCLACVTYLLEQNELNGNTVIDIVKLFNQCKNIAPQCISNYTKALKDDSIYYDVKRKIVALKSTHDVETYIATRINEGLKINNEWNFDCDKYKISNGYELSDDQINGAKYLCKYNISILNGFSGAGKSTSTGAVINMLDDNNKTYLLLAPTGKSSKVLAESTSKLAYTIHRGLGYNGEWKYNENYKLTVDVVIVDEFSMVDIFLFKHLLEAIDFRKTKLMLIGDSAQIPSVQCGCLLHDFLISNNIPTTTLTKIFRYGKGGLMTVATDTRNSKKYLIKSNNKIDFYGENKDYAFVKCSSQDMLRNVIAVYKKMLKKGYTTDDIRVLSSYNKGDLGTGSINNAIQKVANGNCNSTTKIEIGETTYYEDDIVIQNVNNYKAILYDEEKKYNNKENSFINYNYNDDTQVFVANGETGVIEKIIKNKMAVINFDGVRVLYSKEEMAMCRLGYALTIHKSQGSSIKVILLLTPNSHSFMLNSNLIYVGMTRMKEKCFHFGDEITVNRAIKKKADIERDTDMIYLLKNV